MLAITLRSQEILFQILRNVYTSECGPGPLKGSHLACYSHECSWSRNISSTFIIRGVRVLQRLHMSYILWLRNLPRLHNLPSLHNLHVSYSCTISSWTSVRFSIWHFAFILLFINKHLNLLTTNRNIKRLVYCRYG